MHFSTLHHYDSRDSRWTGPQLCSETAASIRSSILTIELSGNTKRRGLFSGISFSEVRPDPTFNLPDNGRYLLLFDTVGRTLVDINSGSYDERSIPAIWKADLRFTYRINDHADFIDREDTWFEYRLLDTKYVIEAQSTSHLFLHLLEKTH